MKRNLLFILIASMVFSGANAQAYRVGTGVARTGIEAASVGGKAVQKIEQQSYRASQAAREAATRLKVNPSALTAVPLVNLITDDHNESNKKTPISNISPIRPKKLQTYKIPKVKTAEELMDESIAQNYEAIKTLVQTGKFDNESLKLIQYADYAKRHGDEEFAVFCLERIKCEHVTPNFLEHVARRYKSLKEYIPEITRSFTVYAYTKMLDAKLNGADSDSTWVKAGNKLLALTGEYNPSLNPLVKLSYLSDPTKEVELYKEAADSVTATYDQWSNEFQETFARDFLITLMQEDEYSSVLNYFEREPFINFVDAYSDFTINLASCAWALNDNGRFNHYLMQAFEMDSVTTQEYWDSIYRFHLDNFIANPAQTEVADWIIENSGNRAEVALNVAVAIVKRFFPDGENNNWEWPDATKYSSEQLEARNSIIYILDLVSIDDKRNTDPATNAKIDFVKASQLCSFGNRTAEADNIIDCRIVLLKEKPSTVTDDVHCLLVLARSFIAGHGLDKPKEALKILKKNINLIQSPEVSDDTRSLWYDYIAAIYERIGKTKDAEKYLNLKK